MSLNTTVNTILLALFLATGLGCNGSETGYANSVNRFVRSLNNSDSGLFTNYDSEVILYTNETQRSQISGEGDWFVIYDDRRDRYMAVRIGYLRGLEGYGYEEYLGELGDSFRSNEGLHRLFGKRDGDNGGDNYEAVDLAADGYFYGRESGHAYEDEQFVTDVNLLSAQSEEREFYRKVAAISYTYSIAPRSAAKLLALGQKVQRMNTDEAMTQSDMNFVLIELEALSGITQSELLEMTQGSGSSRELLKKASKHIGSTIQNLENNLLPELFGINL